MEVGSLREKILIALLIHKFGEKNVETQIRITEPEVDVKLFGKPVSIKTITGMGGVKIIWTVDAQKAREFRENYVPSYDMLLIRINWEDKGYFYYVPSEVQKRIFGEMGRDMYIKLPKPGTNPRGAEISRDALFKLLKDKETQKIEIAWEQKKVDYDPYKRWVDYWEADKDVTEKNL